MLVIFALIPSLSQDIKPFLLTTATCREISTLLVSEMNYKSMNCFDIHYRIMVLWDKEIGSHVIWCLFKVSLFKVFIDDAMMLTSDNACRRRPLPADGTPAPVPAVEYTKGKWVRGQKQRCASTVHRQYNIIWPSLVTSVGYLSPNLVTSVGYL